MSRIKSLRQAKADAYKAMQAAEQKLEAADLTAEQKAAIKTEFRAAKAAFDEAELDLVDAEATQEAERRMRPVGDPDQAAAATAHSAIAVHDRSEDDPMRGYRSAADFARDVRMAAGPTGRESERLMKLRPIQRGAAASGYDTEAGSTEGYEVPAQIRTELFTLVFAADDLLAAMNPEPTDSNAVDIDGDETTPWGATGVQAKWRAEAGQMTGTHVVTNLRTVRLHELYAFVLATDELLSDAPRLNNRITVKSADAIRWKAAEAILFGSGAGQPLGIMKSPALVTVAKDSGQAAATLSVNNIATMYARLLADGGAPFWIANRDILPQLIALVIGQNSAYMPPQSGVTNAPGGTLLGMPIRWSEHAQTLGTTGDLVLANPNGYYATIRGGAAAGMQFASSIHLYFDQNIQAFRWTFRLGGQPYLSAPVSPAKGSNTKSHFVALATR